MLWHVMAPPPELWRLEGPACGVSGCRAMGAPNHFWMPGQSALLPDLRGSPSTLSWRRRTRFLIGVGLRLYPCASTNPSDNEFTIQYIQEVSRCVDPHKV